MSVPTVELTGGATTGTLPGDMPARLLGLIRALPTTVKLGRKPPRAAPRCVALGRFLAAGAPIKPPQRVDWFSKVRESIARVYLNDRLGCCVISSKAHAIGSWTGNDPDSGGQVQATDQEIADQYRRWCGPGDNGCYIPAVLDQMVRGGFQAAGKLHKLGGYVSCDWHDRELLKAALFAFGPLCFGINLPSAWTQNAVWDVTPSQIVGGHDVCAVGYDERGVNVASWGRLYLMTWQAVADSRFVEECYALLSPDWYNADNVAPSGFKVEQLKAALAAVGMGTMPDDPGPVVPPAPPVPPVPPPPAPPPAPPLYDIEGVIELARFGSHGTFTGTARPVPPPNPDQIVEFPELPEPVARSLADALFPVLGATFTVVRGRIKATRGAIPPEVWAQIIQAVMQIVLLILANRGAPGPKTGPQDRAGGANARPDGSGQGGQHDHKGRGEGPLPPGGLDDGPDVQLPREQPAGADQEHDQGHDQGADQEQSPDDDDTEAGGRPRKGK